MNRFYKVYKIDTSLVLKVLFLFYINMVGQENRSYRVIKYLKEENQNPHWHLFQVKLLETLYSAVKTNTIQAYRVDFSNDRLSKPVDSLQIAEFYDKNTIQFYQECLPSTPPVFDPYEDACIGVDKTITITESGPTQNINYLHFYLQGQFVPQKYEPRLYLFSIKWDTYLHHMFYRPYCLRTGGPDEEWWMPQIFGYRNNTLESFLFEKTILQPSLVKAGPKKDTMADTIPSIEHYMCFWQDELRWYSSNKQLIRTYDLGKMVQLSDQFGWHRNAKIYSYKEVFEQEAFEAYADSTLLNESSLSIDPFKIDIVTPEPISYMMYRDQFIDFNFPENLPIKSIVPILYKFMLNGSLKVFSQEINEGRELGKNDIYKSFTRSNCNEGLTSDRDTLKSLYSTDELTYLQLRQRLQFDKRGRIEDVKIVSLALYTPNESCKVIHPIGYVSWQELKSLLVPEIEPRVFSHQPMKSLITRFENGNYLFEMGCVSIPEVLR